MSVCTLCQEKKLSPGDALNKIVVIDTPKFGDHVPPPPDNNQLDNLLGMRRRIKYVMLPEDFPELFNDGALSIFVDEMSHENKTKYSTNINHETVVEFIELFKTEGPPDASQLFHQAVRNVRLPLLEKLMTNEEINVVKQKCFKSLLIRHKQYLKPVMQSCDYLLLNLEQLNVISCNMKNRILRESSDALKLKYLIDSMPLREENWYERFLLCLCNEGSNDYLTIVHPKLAASASDYLCLEKCIPCIIHSECEQLYEMEINIRAPMPGTSGSPALNVAGSSSSAHMTDENPIFVSSRSSLRENRVMEMDAATLPRDIWLRHNPPFVERPHERVPADGMSIVSENADSPMGQLSDDDDSSYTAERPGSFEQHRVSAQVLDLRDEHIVEDSSLPLHSYQWYLCINALKGENVLICSPPGSGKTYMAMYIIKKHLNCVDGGSDNGERRVIYIVPHYISVEHHYKTFMKYFPPDDLIKMHEKDKTSIDPCYDPPNRPIRVLISTADRILSAMKEDPKKFWNCCSLLVFDEAHLCQKNGPYYQIMNSYLLFKYNSSVKPPQIVGFTASPGIRKTGKNDGTLRHLFLLMADLDCYRTACLRYDDYINVLNRPSPREDVFAKPTRKENSVRESLEKVMKTCEDKLKRLHVEKRIKNGHDMKRLLKFKKIRSQVPYWNGLENLETLLEYVSMDVEYLQEFSISLRYLKTLHRALVILNLVRLKDVFQYLELEMKSSDHPFEMQCYTEVKKIVREASKYNDDNLCFNTLRQKIREHLDRKKDNSRVLVIVKDSQICHFLKAAFEEDDQYQDLHAVGILTGACNDNEINDLTTSNQTIRILHEFRERKIKILFLSAITYERLDLAECTLIIRYAHVINEIAMLQTRGHGVAKNTEFLLIYPEEEERLRMKEIDNRAQHELMEETVKAFSQCTGEEIKKKVKHFQEARINRLREGDGDGDGEEMEIQLSLATNNKDYEFICKGCGSVAFDASSLRRQNSMLLCPVEEIQTRSRREDRNLDKPKAPPLVYCKCATCNCDWGEFRNIYGMEWFQPERLGFEIRCKQTQEIVIPHLNKWADFSKLYDVKDV